MIEIKWDGGTPGELNGHKSPLPAAVPHQDYTLSQEPDDPDDHYRILQKVIALLSVAELRGCWVREDGLRGYLLNELSCWDGAIDVALTTLVKIGRLERGSHKLLYSPVAPNGLCRFTVDDDDIRIESAEDLAIFIGGRPRP
jgi:hypothetical protein